MTTEALALWRRAGSWWERLLQSERAFRLELVSPLQILLNLLLLPPLVIVIVMSLVSWSPIQGPEWWRAPFVGLENYVKVLQDPLFWGALGRTLLITVGAVCIEFLLGLGLALLFQRDFYAKRIMTAILLYPMMLPWVVVGSVFYLLFLAKGPVTYLLPRILGPAGGADWLGTPALAFSAIILADVWQWTPFMFLILYSGLAALPKEPGEAAMTLGAGRWHIFRWVTLPMLKPIVIIALVIRALEAFKIFDVVFIMTGGGPGVATETISLYIFRLARVYQQLSYASAMAVLILLSIGVVTFLAVRPLQYREE